MLAGAMRTLCADVHALLGAEDADCVLLSGDPEPVRFCVHSSLLAASSEYFRTLLSERWQQAAGKEQAEPEPEP